MLKSIRSGLIALAVRETFAPILHALGWGHIVTALVGSASAGFWAWVSDKQPIDIIVYLLASFAAIVFLLAFFSNLVAGIRGQPMTLAIRNRLTLGEIATRWANEMQGHPGALTRDEILEELLKAVWEGHLRTTRGIAN